MTYAFIFPGQGSQYVGMGENLIKDFPNTRHVFEQLDDELNQKLTDVILGGPEDQLTLTENAQPALFAVSMAIVRVLRDEFGLDLSEVIKFAAGHSLGEYSALSAFGAIQFSDGVKILKARGKAMQAAVSNGAGSMAAVLGLNILDLEKIVERAAEENEICCVANDNTPEQVVISGSAAAVERASMMAKDAGAKRCVLLQVSAPFHSPLMAPAADHMTNVIGNILVRAPTIPVVSNITAKPENNPNEIRRLLIEQVTGRVRWRESIINMRELGVKQFVEVGAGKVLTGMIRRIDKQLEAISLESSDDIRKFVSLVD